MSSTYPAAFNDTSGLQRLDGSVSFTAAANAPTGPNGLIVKAFPFTYQSAGLATGFALYTPAVGDLIYDIGVNITTAFNGTTPKLDVGTFSGGNNGLYDVLAAAPIDGTKVYADVATNAGLASANSVLWLSSAVGSAGAAAGAAYVSWQLRVSVANPLLLVASQSGAKGGTAITSSAGAGRVLIVTATPS